MTASPANIQNELVEAALRMGAERAKNFTIDDIVFDPRTLLKCLFGCRGGYHYCPTPETIAVTETYTRLAQKYRWGVIMCTDSLSLGQKITLALESQAFLAGYHFAFGVTECAGCKTCSRSENKPCLNPRKKRLPLYALGIDVYSTVRGLGWELNVVQNRGDAAKNITAVFVE